MKNIYLRSFSGVIWKLLIDAQHNQIFLEVRSEQSLDVNYFLLDLVSMNDQQEAVPSFLDWWSRPVFIHDQLLVVQCYEDQTNPGPGPVYTINFKNGESKKIADRFIIDSVDSKEITGTLIDEERQTVRIKLSDKTEEGGEINVDFPELYEENSEEFITVAAFIKEQKGLEPILGIEYFERGDEIFFSYYLKGNNISRFLMVIKDGELMVDQCIDRKVQGLSTESFFILSNKLIFVEDRITLQVYEINE